MKETATERMTTLFERAKACAKTNPELSTKYIKLIEKLSMHYKVKVSPAIKNWICKKCHAIMMPGFNSTIRIVSSRGYVAYKCSTCGKEKHIFYSSSK